jgi:hypothetical protein
MKMLNCQDFYARNYVLFCMSEMETKVLHPRKCEQQGLHCTVSSFKATTHGQATIVNDNIDQACHNLPDKIVA